VIGRGDDPASARTAADRPRLAGRRPRPGATLAARRLPSTPKRLPQAYVDAVADVVDRIAAGELFQANIARAGPAP
jgi:para-aminobenzoate synthetase component 1